MIAFLSNFFCAGFKSRWFTTGSRCRWTHFWFKTLFPGYYAHIGHLVDDVIRLELGKKASITLKGQDVTNYMVVGTADKVIYDLQVKW